MRSRRDHERTMRRQRGFTLLELVLVVGLLLALATLAVPAVISVFSDHAIKEAAESVRTVLAQSRNRAIDYAQPYHFHYEPGGQSFVLIPSEYIRRETLSAAETEDDGSERRLLRVLGILPETMHFEVPEEQDDTVQSLPEQAFGDLPEASDLADAKWSAPLVFYPDGTARDASLMIVEEDEKRMTLSVRGLTGGVTVSRVMRGDAR